MGRAHLSEHVTLADAANKLRVVVGASVLVCEFGTTNAFGQTLYDINNSALANPLTSDADGLVEAYTDYPETVTLLVSGGTPAVTAFSRTAEIKPFDPGP